MLSVGDLDGLVVVRAAELEAMIERAVQRVLDAHAVASAPDEWLDANETAQLLGVHRRTVTRLAGRGELPCSRVGGKLLRYRRADVLRYLEHQQEATQCQG